MSSSVNGEHVPVVRMIARLNVGGPALHAINLSLGMRGRHRTLLVTGNVSAQEADLLPVARARGVRMTVISRLGRSIRPWDDLVVFVTLVRLLRRVRPLVVHTHTAKAGTVGRLAALAANVPIRIHTFHGHVFHGYFGPWKNLVFVTVERLLARVTTRIIAISPRQVEELAGTFEICPREKIRMIPLGLELDRFLPEVSGPLRGEFRREIDAGDRPTIACIGRLVPIKNHNLFLEVAARLTAQGHDYLYVIVGGGESEPAIRARVAELGLTGRVRFLGWRDDLPRIYAGVDLVALTSLNEGTPVCLIEALSAGRAVVSTDVGGVRDVLDGGTLGELVPSGDADAFARAVASLLSDHTRRAAIEARGPQVIPQRYGVARLLADVGSLYDELLSVRPSSALRSFSPELTT